MRTALAILVALALLACVAAPAALANPHSFAVWSSKEATYDDSLTTPVTDGCQKRTPHDDRKTGECISSRLVLVFPRMLAHWQRGIQYIAQGQTAACKHALHLYWLAGRKNLTAATRFFATHRHAKASEMQIALAQDPYASLGSHESDAESHAVRVCG